MSKVKVFSEEEITRGKMITLPLVGDQKFNEEDNSIELEKNDATELLKLNCGLKLVLKVNKKESGEDENLAMLKALEEAEVNDLLATYPDKETKNLKSLDQKIDYLAKKMAK